jgi:uncharacterized spore protein YtfJ
MPDVRETMERLGRIADDARRSMRAQAVFGEPVTHDGVTVVPAASTRGGFGGGGGEGGQEGEGEGAGAGMGFGVSTRPVGAFVITEGQVRWRPAPDVTRMFVMLCMVAIAYFLFGWLSARHGGWRGGSR